MMGNVIMNEHACFMSENEIESGERMMGLPNFYAIPKMHKTNMYCCF